MLQAREKQPENDVSGRVSESCEHFQCGAQFRDTADEYRNIHKHSMRNTCTEHRCRDNTNVTMTTDERSNDDNDEEREQEDQGQGGTKAIYTRYRNGMLAKTEQELRRLMEESTEKYTVYNGRIVTPETIKHLKNHAIVHVVDRLQGGGKKKGQKKQDKIETSSSESDAFADMFIELIRKGKDSQQGNNFFQTLMQVDEGVAQETIDKMKQAIAAEAESFGIRDLSFEVVERWIQENRQATKQAAKAQQDRENQEQERAIQEARRREHEVEKFKEEQRQIMMEKERQAREKREQHEKEAEKQREMNMKELKIRFGRYHGRACESTYQEDRNYCRWVLDVDTGNPALIEFELHQGTC